MQQLEQMNLLASMAIRLYDNQREAIFKLDSGKVLKGGVGSGKTITALCYYFTFHRDKKLIVLTTAKKRDTRDWEEEAEAVGIKDICVDSWNNIKKYLDKTGYFFIFDEQRVSGIGKWSECFIKIAKKNKWILLTATPGDNWLDYMSIFIANGFYRNKTDFRKQHVIYDPFVNYPKVKRYVNERKLQYFRNKVLVIMDDNRKTIRCPQYVRCKYDKESYSIVLDRRWDILKNKPIKNPSRVTQLARYIVNIDVSRIKATKEIFKEIDKLIVFYNYDYELFILENLCRQSEKPYAQWNGHKHEEIPKSDKWIYLVHYSSAEGWNCIETNYILFYSLNYSYKVMEQAEGRIDRLNTPFVDLHYIYMIAPSSIDNSIMAALNRKKKFNEDSWGKENAREGFSKEVHKRTGSHI